MTLLPKRVLFTVTWVDACQRRVRSTRLTRISRKVVDFSVCQKDVLASERMTMKLRKIVEETDDFVTELELGEPDDPDHMVFTLDDNDDDGAEDEDEDDLG
jgi:hypothetical protein